MPESSALFRVAGHDHYAPAAAAFLQWLGMQARAEAVDRMLFLSTGEILPPRTAAPDALGLPRNAPLQGSRELFLLAATHYRNFEERIDVLMSGFMGAPLQDLLRRLDVPVPASHVLENIGLGAGVILSRAQAQPLRRFFMAYRWEILKSAARARRGVFLQLQRLGIEPGGRLAIVGSGFDGEAPHLLAAVLADMFKLDLRFYSLSAGDTARKGDMGPVKAMLGADLRTVLTANRPLLELLFAPGGQVVGYEDHGTHMAAVLRPSRLSDGQIEHLRLGADTYFEGAKGAPVREDPMAGFRSFLDFLKTPTIPAREVLASVLTAENGVASMSGRRRIIPL